MNKQSPFWQRIWQQLILWRRQRIADGLARPMLASLKNLLKQGIDKFDQWLLRHLLPRIYHWPGVAALYYLFNRNFRREQRTVLAARIQHVAMQHRLDQISAQRDLHQPYKVGHPPIKVGHPPISVPNRKDQRRDHLGQPAECAQLRLSPAQARQALSELKRNLHRLEKGLIMRPRKTIFALDYIENTLQLLFSLTTYAQAQIASHLMPNNADINRNSSTASSLRQLLAHLDYANQVIAAYFSATTDWQHQTAALAALPSMFLRWQQQDYVTLQATKHNWVHHANHLKCAGTAADQWVSDVDHDFARDYRVYRDYGQVFGQPTDEICTHEQQITPHTAADMASVSGLKVPFRAAERVQSTLTFADFYRLCQQRRSVRFFLPTKVPISLIEQAFHAAALAPSACNRQPYRFIFVNENPLLATLAKLPLGTQGYHANIPAMVVVVGDLSAYPLERDRHVIYIDSSLATMQAMLALETLGLSSCAINWPDIDLYETRIKTLLPLADYERVIMLMAVGYADPNAEIPHSEKHLMLDSLPGTFLQH